MAAGPFEADLAMPFGVAAKGAGGGKLLARVWYTSAGTFSASTPAGCGWISMRAQGAGGSTTQASNVGGAGGAFSREDRACTPAQAVSVLVRASGTGAQLTQVSLAGVVLCAAPGGGNGDGTAAGGQAFAGVGTIRRSGGNAGLAGENGGSFGPGGGGTAVGGGSAGERDLADCLFPGARGGASATNTNPDGYGGGAGVSTFSGVQSFGGGGAVVIEYWSAKP